jgi:serine phosphatase RsbU (regulator of sigma subunit)
LFENIRERLQRDEHATFSLLRYHSDGRIVFAGAHEEMLVVRTRGGPCERVETPGTWVGAIRNIEKVTVDTDLVLERGDVLVLYTDGAIEGRDAHGQAFGLDRLCDAIEGARSESVQAMRDSAARAVDAWTETQADDVTLLFVRYVGSR